MKENIIKDVANAYQSLLRKNNFFPDYNQELKFYDIVANACSRHLPWEKFILAVETSYFALEYEFRRIIKCEFFYKNYSFWWEEFFTRKQFKKYRDSAITNFYENLVKTHAITKTGELNYEQVS